MGSWEMSFIYPDLFYTIYFINLEITMQLKNIYIIYIYWILSKLSFNKADEIFWVKGRRRSCRFLRIFTHTNEGYFRLGYVLVNECPEVLEK